MRRLMPPRPTRTNSPASARRRLTRRAIAHPPAKHAAVNASSSQPNGVDSSVLIRLKSTGGNMAGSLADLPRAGPARSGALEDRGEESVASVAMGKEAKVGAGVESDMGARQLGCRIAARERRMRSEKAIDDGVVLVGKDAACRVDEAPAALHERCRRREDCLLLAHELGERGFRLP